MKFTKDKLKKAFTGLLECTQNADQKPETVISFRGTDAALKSKVWQSLLQK
jgi:hypothetical protein